MKYLCAIFAIFSLMVVFAAAEEPGVAYITKRLGEQVFTVPAIHKIVQNEILVRNFRYFLLYGCFCSC
ncbi:unnamed protein product [Acanthoscelides obtectus]|uniref:Uncharacterized protein n=1 Tax=Acanthoscelides obtectus TaxID=200917 RepID=A0A9P0L6U6_ACAOB|nr:unnamed protein product [Acanthoscelides obtectus]CAK1620869.1 hypothetical protein AOBTE_LOCUS629 [Acanthoscelides obtectus]